MVSTVGGVVVAADATRAAEDRLVGPPEPAEHVEDRQAHGRSDAVQHPQEGDAEEGDEGEDEVGAALAPKPTQSGDVGEGQRCGDDDCCERGLRKVAEQSGRGDEHGDDRCSSDQAGDLGSASRSGTRPRSAIHWR